MWNFLFGLVLGAAFAAAGTLAAVRNEHVREALGIEIAPRPLVRHAGQPTRPASPALSAEQAANSAGVPSLPGQDRKAGADQPAPPAAAPQPAAEAPAIADKGNPELRLLFDDTRIGSQNVQP